MKLSNVDVRWAKVFEPDTKFNPKWCVDLFPAPEVLKKLKKDGFVIKQTKDGMEFIHAKQNVTRKDGTKNDPPTIVGRDGKTPFTALIGNGSTVNVLCYDYTYQGNKYLGLKAMQVTKHVPYGEGFDNLDGDDDEKKDDPLFEDAGGDEEY